MFWIRVEPRFVFLLINFRFESHYIYCSFKTCSVGFNGVFSFSLLMPPFYFRHHCRLFLFLSKFVLLFQFLDFPCFRFTKILFYFLLRNTVCFLTAVRFFFHIFVIYFFGKFNFFSNGSLFFTFFSYFYSTLLNSFFGDMWLWYYFIKYVPNTSLILLYF